MKYKHYEYIGAKIGVPLYYCMEENKFYLHHVPVVKSKKIVGIVVPLIPISSVIIRKWNVSGLYYNEKAFVIISAILGIGIGMFLYFYIRRAHAKYFSEIQPSEPLPRETLEELVRYEIGMNWTWRFCRIMFLITLIGVPIMLRGKRNLFLLFSYPVLWFIEVFALVYVNLRNRKKMIKNIKKIYIKNQDNQENL